MRKFNITPPSDYLREVLKERIDLKTKPIGALGMLEQLALQIGLIQNSVSPRLENPSIVVFAGDHGVTEEGVSAYPQEVTYQMVINIIQGGAAISVFCKQNELNMYIVDAGVNYDFPENLSGLINSKIRKGTRNFSKVPAMAIEEVNEAIDKGAAIVTELNNKGCNIIGFGEMGIGNTSSASALLNVISGIPIELCVGKGTGLSCDSLDHKINIIKNAIALHDKQDSTLNILATYGGLEIAQMVGAILQAAEHKMIVLIDGFIATAAFLVAHEFESAVLDYSIFCHQSEEPGHKKMLEFLNVKPILQLDMRLGEGSGVAIAYPIIKASVSFLNEMASFKNAGVSQKNENELV